MYPQILCIFINADHCYSFCSLATARSSIIIEEYLDFTVLS